MKTRINIIFLVVLGLVLVSMTALASTASAQATRTWVSGVGDDANPCSRTAPCKTFAGAISKTATGGEIDALDPGGFGAVTITKSITIDGMTGGSILNSATSGVTVNAGVTGDVVLRNLTINGAGSPNYCGVYGGNRGVYIYGGRSLRMDNVQIQNQNFGIEAPATNVSGDIYFDLTLNDVNIANSCTAGIGLVPDVGKKIRSVMRNVSVSNSNTALKAGAGAEVWAADSSFSLNNAGLDTTGGGLFKNLGGSFSVGNADGKALPAPETNEPPVVQPTFCKVPSLKGKKKAAAQSAVKAASCAVGKTSTKKLSKKQKKSKGKVLGQTIPAGTEVKVGTKVGITVGR
jgi:hypothetical protein